MATIDTIKVFINRMCSQMGTTADAIYNPGTNAWYFSRGSSTIEVFLTEDETRPDDSRVYLRCFAPLMPMPSTEKRKQELYAAALEANAGYIGLKLCVIPERGYLCAVAEKDIHFMDYNDMVGLILDIATRADQLDDFMVKRFG